MRLLPDQERAQALRLLGLHRNIGHDGVRRATARPVHEAADILSPSFEDRLDPAVGKVAYPPAHSALARHPLAAVAEEDTLDLAMDQDPVADHSETLRRDRTHAVTVGRDQAHRQLVCRFRWHRLLPLGIGQRDRAARAPAGQPPLPAGLGRGSATCSRGEPVAGKRVEIG